MNKFRFHARGAASLALAICVVLGGAAALGLLSPGSARTQQDPAGALPSHSEIGEGPGGRTQLTQWTLRQDRANQGLRLGWARGGFDGRSVSVPNDVEPLPYSGAGGLRSFNGSVAWYKTTFTAPGSGGYALSFHSASYFAQVWVDGHLLGSHKGAYLPFEFHKRLAAGRHTLVVRIDWRNVEGQSKEGFHRTWFNWGGLNGQVEVRPTGESDLSHPTIQTTVEPAGAGSPSALVKVSVDVHNAGPQRTITPEGTLVRGSQTITLNFPAQQLAHGQTATTAASVTVRDPALWSPSSPSLYQLTLAVGHESSFTAQVGLRELSWSGGRLYLNGQRLQLHGATVQEDVYGHGDALTASAEDALVSELKRIGANAARAQHPLNPALLERLDAAGILVVFDQLWLGEQRRPAGAHSGTGGATAPVDRRLEPGRRGREQRLRRLRGPVRAVLGTLAARA
jgi:beta-galactosidase/beta-glucuronidase